MAEGDEKLLTELDDDFHAPLSDSWWETETVWFSFYVPERRIGAWLYNFVRPNIGVTGGGVMLYDDLAWSHVETPYYRCYNVMQLPEKRDLRDITFPSGVAVTALRPLTSYRLTFDDSERLTLDVQWDAITDPWVGKLVDGTPRHLDQFGRVTGHLVLHGERLEIDCYAMRDRSWQHTRREQWKDGGGNGYTCGAADASASVFMIGEEQASDGFLVLDGHRAGLAHGRRRVERDPATSQVSRVVLTGKDTEGRDFEVVSSAVSKMAMTVPGVQGVCWTTMLDMSINGTHAWGEDQDFWPINGWAKFRRKA